MIIFRKAFYNKHRAYLLIFAVTLLGLRLPVLVANKLERVALAKFKEISDNLNMEIIHKNLHVHFTKGLNIDSLEFVPAESGKKIIVDSFSLKPFLRYPLRADLQANTLGGTLNCSFTKTLFSDEIGLSCTAMNLETSQFPFLMPYNVNGPLSFKVSGNISNVKSDLSGEFLSQIDSANFIMPKEVPSFFKLPSLGILDLKGNFKLNDRMLNLSNVNLACMAGDMEFNVVSEFDTSYAEVLKLESDLRVKLTPSGQETIGPWIGLVLGGVQLPNSGQVRINVSGSSMAGFNAKLQPF